MQPTPGANYICSSTCNLHKYSQQNKTKQTNKSKKQKTKRHKNKNIK